MRSKQINLTAAELATVARRTPAGITPVEQLASETIMHAHSILSQDQGSSQLCSAPLQRKGEKKEKP